MRRRQRKSEPRGRRRGEGDRDDARTLGAGPRPDGAPADGEPTKPEARRPLKAGGGTGVDPARRRPPPRTKHVDCKSTRRWLAERGLVTVRERWQEGWPSSPSGVDRYALAGSRPAATQSRGHSPRRVMSVPSDDERSWVVAVGESGRGGRSTCRGERVVGMGRGPL